MRDTPEKIIRKLQSYYFNTKLCLYGVLGLPAQTGKERQIFKAVFDLSSENGKLRIFEWGSGYSTLYFADYLHHRGVDFEWHTIDNNLGWHKKVQTLVNSKKLDSYVHLYLSEFQPFWEKPDWGPVPPLCGAFGPKTEAERAYVDYPRQLGLFFDVIIVDARFRRHCIQSAKDVLKPDGLVVLHDAQKSHYHDGLELFSYGMFVDTGAWYPLQKEPNRIWIGSLGNHAIFEFLKSY